VIATGEAIVNVPITRSVENGTVSEHHFLASFFPVKGASGEIDGVGVVVLETTERRQLEEQLLQSQKMEAVGRLAGGVAHDFNNILTAIKSYSDLLVEDMGAGRGRVEDVQEIREAADRAATLTRQLLTFSRQQMLRPRVLDLNVTVRDLKNMLDRLERAGYTKVRATIDSRDVESIVDEFNPDLVLLDLHMPHVDGFAVLKQLGPRVTGPGYFPVLMLTGDATSEAKRGALSLGARDFVAKPFDASEVLSRIRNLLETRLLYRALEQDNGALQSLVRARTRDLDDSQVEIVERLAKAAEIRDDDTGRHTQRVARQSALLAEALGMGERFVELIRRAAPLHDVGKIGIPEHPAEGAKTDGSRNGDRSLAHGDRREDSFRRSLRPRENGRANRAQSPRAVERLRLPTGPERRGHSAGSPNSGARGRSRRADPPSPLSARLPYWKKRWPR
jgi:CheY-like chemotaxis protein